MLSETFNCGSVCNRILEFLSGDFFLGLVVALLAGWGAVLIQEKSAAKRERAARFRDENEAAKTRLMDHVTELVKWYHVNIRILRQNPEDRSISDLNLAHASFIAHAKLLAIEPDLKNDANALREISRSMSQLWPVDLKKSSRDAGLEAIYVEFASVLEKIVEHIRSLDKQHP